MIYLDPQTVVVFDHADVNTAVSSNNGINYVYLGADIVLTGGISISTAKTLLVINGEYEGMRHTFTDRDSTSALDAFGLRGGSSMTLTLQNMTINGRNYYGIPYIDSLYTTDNLTLIYDGVTYDGPQMTYNLKGLTRYIDCDITIEQTGVAEAQEVGEVNRVEIGGTTTISHRSTNSTRAVFWFEGTASTMAFTVLENARVDISSENNYFMYNYLDILFTRQPVRYLVRSGAVFNLYTNVGFSHSDNHRASSFTVEDNASFRYIQGSANSTYSSLYLDGALTVGEGSSFYMQAGYTGARSLIHFTITGTPIEIDNPKSFVVYSRDNAALSFAASTTRSFNITGGQINYWDPATPLDAGAGTLADIPDYKWALPDFSAFRVWGTVTPTATTVTSSEPPPEQFGGFANLRLQTAKVLSIGDLHIVANLVTDDGSPVSGWTEPLANVRIEYPAAAPTHTLDSAADANGNFSVSTEGETPPEIPAGTDIAIWSNTPFLIADIIVTAISAGDLIITYAPVQIVFRVAAILQNPTLLPRRIPDDPVDIEDTRTEESQWELMASISGPLTTPSGRVLPDALVYRNSAGELSTLNSRPVAVYTGGPAPGPTRVTWDETEGILVRVTEPIRAHEVYSTYIIWTLRVI